MEDDDVTENQMEIVGLERELHRISSSLEAFRVSAALMPALAWARFASVLVQSWGAVLSLW
jgi:hypothetical protein